jgi:quercetin dioxygenase-like cupin family protein
MRIFDIDPGASSPFYAHSWEHEIFILKGKADVKNDAEVKVPVREGDSVFVPPNEKHCLINRGEDTLRSICLVPTGSA